MTAASSSVSAFRGLLTERCSLVLAAFAFGARRARASAGASCGTGTSAPAFTTGVHNVFYRPAAEALGGRESLSLFVNSFGDYSYAAAFEFEIKLVDEGSASDPGDDTHPRRS